MTIYDDLKPIVAEVMSEFKQGVVKLVQVSTSGGTFDEPAAQTTAEVTLDAVANGVSYAYVRNGMAVATDLMVTAAVVAGVTPTMKDFIKIDGVTHKIVQIINVPAAGTQVVWKFIVRKGG